MISKNEVTEIAEYAALLVSTAVVRFHSVEKLKMMDSWALHYFKDGKPVTVVVPTDMLEHSIGVESFIASRIGA